jgi:acyl-CoA synthetase (AMP-forming)/AMP-acid ligase II
MKSISLFLAALLATALAGCAIVPLDPYGPSHREHRSYGYDHDRHEHRDRR